jgi:hypothetical protein
MRMKLFLCSLVAASISTCAVSFDDDAIRLCDPQLACREGRVCINGMCVISSVPDGGTGRDGGTPPQPDSGRPMPMVDSGMPTAKILWSQARDGFNSMFTDPGCMYAVDTAMQNRINVSVLGSGAKGDSAVGQVVPPLGLPTANSGRIRGKVTLPGAPQIPGKMTLVFFDDSKSTAVPAKPWLSVGITPDNKLIVTSAANTMTVDELTQSGPVSPGFTAGTYTIDLQWRLGGKRELALNGAVVSQVNMPATAGAEAVNRLSIGIRFIEGEDGGANGLSAFDWQMVEDPTALGAFP